MMGSAYEKGLIPDRGMIGRRNTISDVAGVTVGHVTLSKPDKGLQTGVTVIRPHGGNVFSEPVPAMIYVGNGYGKFIGLSQVMELGELETPIAITNTLSAPEAASGLIDWTLQHNGEARSVNPVVGEINDGKVNAIRERQVRPQHIIEALNAATADVAEGNVGAGAGGEAYGWKGGVGSSSRVVRLGGKQTTVGVLTVINIPGRFAPRGFRVTASPTVKSNGVAHGSIIMVVATDAPVGPRNLGRMASRSLLGVARTGSVMPNGSGDYAIAFRAQGCPRSDQPSFELSGDDIPNSAMDPLFEAVVAASEEAVLNAMVAAETVITSVGQLERYPFPSSAKAY